MKPNGLNICPLIPEIRANGINTTQVVAVPPMMDSRTAAVPSIAAFLVSTKPPPLSVKRKQLSRTTIELSTIIPTPRTRLDRVMTFNVKPMVFMRMRAAKIDTGMEVPTIRDALISPKNSQMMSIATMTAMIMVWNTLFKELLI